MRWSLLSFLLIISSFLLNRLQADIILYDGPAGTPGSKAIAHNDTRIVGWATSGIVSRGPQNIDNPSGPLAAFGVIENAFGPAGTNTGAIVSLGDGGSATLTFANPIRNGLGPDFAVFENGFADSFLELAYVEVSSDSTNFFRFPSHSQTQSTTQVGAFDPIDPTLIYNLAGKYRVGFGTPFDLEELTSQNGLDVNNILAVRVVDVVGRMTAAPGNLAYIPSLDSFGNIINDPYATAFSSGGFDLDGVGVIQSVPEPSSAILLTTVTSVVVLMRRRHRLPL